MHRVEQWREIRRSAASPAVAAVASYSSVGRRRQLERYVNVVMTAKPCFVEHRHRLQASEEERQVGHRYVCPFQFEFVGCTGKAHWRRVGVIGRFMFLELDAATS